MMHSYRGFKSARSSTTAALAITALCGASFGIRGCGEERDAPQKHATPSHLHPQFHSHPLRLNFASGFTESESKKVMDAAQLFLLSVAYSGTGTENSSGWDSSDPRVQILSEALLERVQSFYRTNSRAQGHRGSQGSGLNRGGLNRGGLNHGGLEQEEDSGAEFALGHALPISKEASGQARPPTIQFTNAFFDPSVSDFYRFLVIGHELFHLCDLQGLDSPHGQSERELRAWRNQLADIESYKIALSRGAMPYSSLDQGICSELVRSEIDCEIALAEAEAKNQVVAYQVLVEVRKIAEIINLTDPNLDRGQAALALGGALQPILNAPPLTKQLWEMNEEFLRLLDFYLKDAATVKDEAYFSIESRRQPLADALQTGNQIQRLSASKID